MLNFEACCYKRLKSAENSADFFAFMWFFSRARPLCRTLAGDKWSITPSASKWLSPFHLRHSPNDIDCAQVRLRLACQPCNYYWLPVNGLLYQASLPCVFVLLLLICITFFNHATIRMVSVLQQHTHWATCGRAGRPMCVLGFELGVLLIMLLYCSLFDQWETTKTSPLASSPVTEQPFCDA